MLEHVGALLRVELFQNVGNVGRVQFFQARVAYRKLHLRKVAIEQFHVVPGDDALVDGFAERFRDAAGGFFNPGGQAAQNAAYAHFSAQKAQLRARSGKLQVVYAHDLHALRVDDLAIKQVACQQNLGRLQVAEADGRAVHLQADAFFFAEAFHVFAPGNHERRFAWAQESQAGDTREHFAGLNGQIGNGADLFAICVDDGFAEHLR